MMQRWLVIGVRYAGAACGVGCQVKYYGVLCRIVGVISRELSDHFFGRRVEKSESGKGISETLQA